MGETFAGDGGLWSRNTPGSRAPFACATLAFLTMSAACSAPISATGAQAEFQCTVTGSEYVSGSLGGVSVCDTFKSRIDKMLPKPTRSVKSISNAGDHDWMKLEVRISKKDSASAVLTRKQGAQEVVHPEIVIDVMDKALGKQELERLADEVAKLVSNKVEN